MERDQFIDDKLMYLSDKHLRLLLKYNSIDKESDIAIDNYHYKFIDLYYIEEYNKYYIKVMNYTSKNTVNIKPEYITAINGMSIYRFLNSCNITEDGKISELLINFETDVNKDIKGKKSYMLDGEELYNGQKIILKYDKDESINGQTLTVKGCNTEKGIYFTLGRGRKRTVKAALRYNEV